MKYLISAVSFLIIFFVFQINLFHTAPTEWFQDFEKGSEGLVIAAMIHSRYKGSTSQECIAMTGGGAMLKRESWACDTPVKIGMGGYGYAIGNWPANVYTAFSNNQIINHPTYTYYTSALGLQGHLFTLLYKMFGITKIYFYQSINSFLLALIFCIFIFIVYIEFGISAAFILFIVTITSPWLIVAARNLYWIPWTWFLPLLTVMITMCKPNLRKFGFLIYAVAVAIKLLCGYEYASSVLLASLIPILYIALRDRWSAVKIFKELATYSSFALVGIIIAFTLHAYARADSIKMGFISILGDANRRTAGVPGVSETMESINASRFTILRKYLNETAGMPISSISPFSFKVSIFLIFLIASYLYMRSNKKGKSLSIVFFLSILPPLSWFFLAKQHAYLHTHLVYVLWSLPTLFVGAVCSGYFIQDIVVRMARKKSRIYDV